MLDADDADAARPSVLPHTSQDELIPHRTNLMTATLPSASMAATNAGCGTVRKAPPAAGRSQSTGDDGSTSSCSSGGSGGRGGTTGAGHAESGSQLPSHCVVCRRESNAHSARVQSIACRKSQKHKHFVAIIIRGTICKRNVAYCQPCHADAVQRLLQCAASSECAQSALVKAA